VEGGGGQKKCKGEQQMTGIRHRIKQKNGRRYPQSTDDRKKWEGFMPIEESAEENTIY